MYLAIVSHFSNHESFLVQHSICWTALAIDMTARNVQDEVKKKGLPWTTAKGFDTFTPVG